MVFSRLWLRGLRPGRGPPQGSRPGPGSAHLEPDAWSVGLLPASLASDAGPIVPHGHLCLRTGRDDVHMHRQSAWCRTPSRQRAEATVCVRSHQQGLCATGPAPGLMGLFLSTSRRRETLQHGKATAKQTDVNHGSGGSRPHAKNRRELRLSHASPDSRHRRMEETLTKNRLLDSKQICQDRKKLGN